LVSSPAVPRLFQRHAAAHHAISRCYRAAQNRYAVPVPRRVYRVCVLSFSHDTARTLFHAALALLRIPAALARCCPHAGHAPPA